MTNFCVIHKKKYPPALVAPLAPTADYQQVTLHQNLHQNLHLHQPTNEHVSPMKQTMKQPR